MAISDFTGNNIQDTYQRVVQTDGTNLADGTGSLLPISFDGNNVIISGSLTATEYSVSSSVTNIVIATKSGSTAFGDSIDDIHQFTGSVNVSGSLNFTDGDVSVRHITASGNISASGNIIGNSIVGTIGTATQGTVDHDSLANFVANEHIDHSAVSVIAGTGLTGGGTIDTNRTLNVIGGTGVTANANDIAIGQDVATTANVTFDDITSTGNISSSGNIIGTDITVADDLFIKDSIYTVGADDPSIKLSSNFKVELGDVDGAGNETILTVDNANFKISTSHQLDVTGNITASGNIISSGTITGNSIVGTIGTATQGTINHDSLANFVANEHIDHSAVSVIAGTGLTGGGTIAANRTLNVIGGTGVTANANDIAIGQDVATTADVVFNKVGSVNIIATSNISASGNVLGANADFVGTGSFDAGIRIQSPTNSAERGYHIDNSGPYILTITRGDESNELLELNTLSPSATVSGLISASGYISTNSHITASGDISASGDILASSFRSKDQTIGLYHAGSGTIRLADTSEKTRIDGTNIKLDAPVTASGDISSSGNFIGQNIELLGNSLTMTHETSPTIRLKDTTNNFFVDLKMANSFGIEVDGNSNSDFYIATNEYNGTTATTTALYMDGGDGRLSLNDQAVAIDVAGNITASGNITAVSLDVDTRKVEISSGTDGNHKGGDVVFFGSTTSMTTGAIYHFKSDGTWELADADDNTKSDGLLGVALGAASDTNGVLLRGMVTLDHDPGAVGDPIYLTTTAGDASATAPSGNGNIVRIIGYCLHASAGNIWFNPDSTFVEVSA